MVAPVRCATPGTEVRLRDVALRLAQRDDPVGEHAAALAPHREDGDLDRLRARGPWRGSERGSGEPALAPPLQASR